MATEGEREREGKGERCCNPLTINPGSTGGSLIVKDAAGVLYTDDRWSILTCKLEHPEG